VSARKLGLSQQSHLLKEPLLGRVIERFTITSLFREGIRGNKGFDPFTISWADKGEALDEFSLFIKRELYPILGRLFKVGAFATYKEEAILDVLVYQAIHGVTSENGARAFKEEYKKGPSPRTIRYRLEKMKLSEVLSAFLEANEKILFYFKKKKRLDNSVLLPLDPTHIPCYGKRKKYACGMKRKRGTNYGYKNGVSVVAAPGARVALNTGFMTELDNNPDMLEKLINEARRHVTIKAVLLDREFFNEPCIEKLEALEVTYVMPAKKTRKDILQSLRPPCKAEIPLGSINVSVIALKDPKDPRKTLYYCMNMVIPLNSLRKVFHVYRSRWTVENVFKPGKSVFMAKTYSVNPFIRVFFWILSLLLYNAWALCNLCAFKGLKLNPAQQERPLITAFQCGVHMKPTFLSPLFSDSQPEELLKIALALVNLYLLQNSAQERIIPHSMMFT
jgi:hypothetical protein